jgi:hypothetical protein
MEVDLLSKADHAPLSARDSRERRFRRSEEPASTLSRRSMTIEKPSKSRQTFWTCITRSVFGVGRHSKSSFSPLFPCPFATDDKVAGHKALEDAAIQVVDDLAVRQS